MVGCKAKGELREEVTGSQEGRGEWYILGVVTSAKGTGICLSSERTDGTLQRKGLACKCCSLVGREDMANRSPQVKAWPARAMQRCPGKGEPPGGCTGVAREG